MVEWWPAVRQCLPRPRARPGQACDSLPPAGAAWPGNNFGPAAASPLSKDHEPGHAAAMIISRVMSPVRPPSHNGPFEGGGPLLPSLAGPAAAYSWLPPLAAQVRHVCGAFGQLLAACAGGPPAAAAHAAGWSPRDLNDSECHSGQWNRRRRT